ncbi:hypothetical protein ENZ74_08130, partial [Mesorhizobium sp. M7A.F.Ca.CA.002.15.2.1]
MAAPLDNFKAKPLRAGQSGFVASAVQRLVIKTASSSSRCLPPRAAAGEVSADDKTYLSQLVAVRTGLSEADARTRVDAVLAKAQD